MDSVISRHACDRYGERMRKATYCMIVAVLVLLFCNLARSGGNAPSLSPASLSFKRVQPYRVSFILGGPAAGKSTQCKKLVEAFGCRHLSAGDLLRDERESGSETAELIETCIRNGAIVPVEITLNLIRKAMEKSTANRFLIDGFPRNYDNLEGWLANMSDSCIVDSMICLDCPEEECERRILERAKTSQRSDDNLDTLKKRFVTFKEGTLPVITAFENLGTRIPLPTKTQPDASGGSSPISGTITAAVTSPVRKTSMKRVYRIAGDRFIDNVYSDMRAVYEEMVSAELLELTQLLLQAEDEGDEDVCASLVSTDRTELFNSYGQHPTATRTRLATPTEVVNGAMKGEMTLEVLGGRDRVVGAEAQDRRSAEDVAGEIEVEEEVEDADGPESKARRSSMASARVRVLGKTALVTYLLLVQEKLCPAVDKKAEAVKEAIGSTFQTLKCEETLVWNLDEFGTWKNVHRHRVLLA